MNVNLEHNLEKSTKMVGLFLVLAYALGFLAWNIHLSTYGYFEYDLIQTRFLSTGTLILIIFSIPALFSYSLLSSLKKDTLSAFFFRSIFGFIFAVSFVLFVQYLFPKISQSYGGAYPFTKWLIADPDEIEFLSNFNLLTERNGDKRSVQTGLVCEIYSNRDIMIVGARGEEGNNKRILILRKEYLKGFQSVPPVVESEAKDAFCSDFYH